MKIRNYIAGSWSEAGSEALDRNPSDLHSPVAEYVQAGTNEALEAIAAAKVAFAAWSRTSSQVRHDILKQASDEILARREELGKLLSTEEGKTLPEAIGETVRAGQVFGFFAQEALRIPGEKVASVRPGVEVDIMREPVGVVGLITPWNFPIAIPAWKIAPALAYGNTVVIKPADATPACAWALADILDRAGIPAGVFNLVMGRGSVAGEAILSSPDVDAISFTGSMEIGRHIAAAAVSGSRMKKFQLEMGGKNPLVVLDDATLAVAVDCALNGAYFSTGQRCTASSRLIVTEGIHDRFVAMLADRMRALTIGHALDPTTDIGPVVDEKQMQQNLSYIRLAGEEGARLVAGGDVIERDTKGHFLTPALFADADNSMRVCREEIFGPVATVIRVKDYDEALAVANDTEFGLSSGICTTSLKHASHFRRNAEAGMVMVNLPTAGVDFHVPFGGRKNSSYGPREQGRYAAEFYTTLKTAYILP